MLNMNGYIMVLIQHYKNTQVIYYALNHKILVNDQSILD